MFQGCSSDSDSFTSSSSSSSESIGPIISTQKTRESVPFCLRVSKSEAPWARMLSNNVKGLNTIDIPDTRDGRYFRRRFRIPFSLFMALINIMVREGWFLGLENGG
jgi:hypothetical protein